MTFALALYLIGLLVLCSGLNIKLIWIFLNCQISNIIILILFIVIENFILTPSAFLPIPHPNILGTFKSVLSIYTIMTT